ncbi:hypothetical protein GCM10010358_82330 [Streptomyces minutiscleroticus]|uniref:Uncharacterized protein n=1 Tax=Streptomyces minutiscleroticus TaxID=68238 RepID=A0A918UAU1_9ACTN|nr:hypothetical protein [Streptomyces minutiscleroticus]GGY18765.1 hypothetical protein GCM10010358_82330 [Streptomyces minutiscleroticus]
MKHRKISKNRRRMYSIAAGTVLAAAGTAGIASAHDTVAVTPDSHSATPVGSGAEEAHGAEEAYGAEEAGGPAEPATPNAGDSRPYSELTPEERASAVG